MEAMRRRVKDVEFTRREILVRDGKGNKDRVTMLPVRLIEPLHAQIEHARELHRGDLLDGFGAMWLPFALNRKYLGAAKEWCWQYLPVPERVRPILAMASCAAIISRTRGFSGR